MSAQSLPPKPSSLARVNNPLSFAVVGIVLLLAQASAPLPPRVWVDAPAPLKCPDQDALLAALRFSLGKDRIAIGKARPGEPSLSLRLRGAGGLTVVLRRAGTTLGERDLHVASDDCPALANTIALLTEAWLTAPPAPRPAPPITNVRSAPSGQSPSPAPAPIAAGSLPDPRPEASPPPPAATPKPESTATPPANLPVTPAEPTKDVPPPAPAVAPAAQPLPDPAAAPPAVPAREPAPPVEKTPAAPAWSMSLAAALGGMAALPSFATPVARAIADLRLDRGRWFLGIRGAAEDRANLDPTADKLWARHIPASAYLGHALVASGALRLEILVGGGVDVVLASTSGYGNERSFKSVSPLIQTGVQAEWLLGRHFGIVAASELLVALQREQFVVANVGPVAKTERVRAGLALGVAWHLR